MMLAGPLEAASNLVVMGLYTMSRNERSRGRRAFGIARGTAGAAPTTFGGHLHGHLAFGQPQTGDQAS
jgi:hypothetical protein